jgi:hypothetical protein
VRLEPGLNLVTNNLFISGYPNKVCLYNNTTTTITGVTLKFTNIYSEGSVLVGDMVAGAKVCKVIDTLPISGLGVLYAQGTVGTDTVVTETIPVLLVSEIPPGYDSPTPGSPYLLIAFKAGTHFIQVYRGTKIPRPRDVDYLFVELTNGAFDVLTRKELDDGIPPSFARNKAVKLEITYQFPSPEAMARFLELIGGYLAKDNFSTEADFYSLPVGDRVKLMLPYVNFMAKRTLFTTMVKADTASKTITYIQIITGGLPLLAWVAIGFLAGAVGTIGVYTLASLFKVKGAEEIIDTTVKTSNTEIETMGRIAEAIIDALDPRLFVKDKEVVKQEIRSITTQAKEENERVGEIAKANVREPPGLVDKVKDFAVKGAVAIVGWEVLKRVTGRV